MNKILNRRTLRRGYLFKKMGYYSIIGFSGLISSIGFTVFSIAALALLVIRFLVTCDDKHPCSLNSNIMFFAHYAPLLGISLTSGLIAFFGCWKTTDAELAIPRVPPLRKQIPFLPDDEVLLRGSQSPEDTSAELLRSTYENQYTPIEELLHPSIGS